MTARFFCRGDNFRHGRVALPEAYIVRDRIVEEVDVLKHETEIFHKAVHAVRFYVFAAQKHAPFLHVPKARNKAAQRRLSAARRSDKSRRRFFGDMQRHAVDDLPRIVRKADIFDIDIAFFRRNVFPARIHRLQIEDGFRFIDTRVDDAKQRGIISRRIEMCVDHKRAYDHDNRDEQIHRARDIQCDRKRAHHNAERFGDKILHGHVADKLLLHPNVDIGVAVDRFDEFFRGRSGEIVRFYFRNTLNIFEDAFDKGGIGSHLLRSKHRRPALHHRVYDGIKRKPQNDDDADSPIVKQNHRRDKHRI